MIKYNRSMDFNLLLIQVFLGVILGSLCYALNSIIKENTNFIVIFMLITFIAYYLQKNVFHSLIIIPPINISITELIGSSVIICIHSFVFWSLLLNIF